MSLASFYGGAHKGSVFGYSAQYGDGYHWGQDIDDHDEGTPIPALAAGRVARAGWQVAHGWWTAVDTGDGWYDTYSHMVGLWHDVGAELGQGDAVGPLGTTGLSTGPHLHTQRTRNPFPWSHGTEIDPWPRIANLITASAGGGTTPFDPEEDDMPIVLERGIDTGFMVTYPTPRGISRVVIDSIANARGVVEQATKSKIVQMYPADFDAFVRVFGPIYAPPAGSDAAADRDYAELLAEIRALPTAAENAEEFAKRLAG